MGLSGASPLGEVKTKAPNSDYRNHRDAPPVAARQAEVVPPPQLRPGPHHPRPGAPRRQRRGDADGRGRSTPLLRRRVQPLLLPF